MAFLAELKKQRWDDHRYYHHSRINQFFHLVSAMTFLTTYALVFFNPVVAAMLGWFVAMCLRQVGHFFFEPKTYDTVNEATHEYKESIKVGYNLHRKVVLLGIWMLIPVLVYFDRDLGGIVPAAIMAQGYLHTVSILWIVLGAGAVLFRTAHLFFIADVETGLVWATKILTDPFHDIRMYYKAPWYIVRGELIDPMHHVRS